MRSKRDSIDIRLSPEEKRRLQPYADELGMTVNAFIGKALDRYIAILDYKKITDLKKEAELANGSRQTNTV